MFGLCKHKVRQMRHSTCVALSLLLASGSSCVGLPAVAGNFHVGITRPATSRTPRSSASRLTAKANARASYAAGDPYVNPNVAAGARTTQDNARANADAAEIRSANESVTTP
jgi:hypothetical protein